MRKRQEYKKHPPSRLTTWVKRSPELISTTRNLNLMKQLGEAAERVSISPYKK